MPRVLVVDDEPQIGDALRDALEREGYDVLLARDGGTAIELVASGRPDLVVLDLMLPDLDGVEVVRRLRPGFTGPVLVLSGVQQESRRVQALDGGADDFLTKPFGMDELQARLRALLRRGRPAVETTPWRFGDLVVDPVAREVRRADEPVALTPTEWRLLEALAAHPGKLLTHRWLLTQVWGQAHGDETRQSLRAHLRSLRAKIGDRATHPRYIRTESGSGYRWLPGPDEALGDPETATPPGSRADVVHELNNVLTAMRFAIFLASPARPDPAPASSPAGDALHRLERLVTRAGDLVARLDPAPPYPDEDEDPDGAEDPGEAAPAR